MYQVDYKGNFYGLNSNGEKQLRYPIRQNELYKIYETKVLGCYQYVITAKNGDGKFELLPRELSPHKNMPHQFEFIGEDLAFAYSKEAREYGENNVSHWRIISRSKEEKFEDVTSKLDGSRDVRGCFNIEKLYYYGALYVDIRALPTTVIHRTYQKQGDDYVLTEENGKKIERKADGKVSAAENRSAKKLYPHGSRLPTLIYCICWTSYSKSAAKVTFCGEKSHK